MLLDISIGGAATQDSVVPANNSITTFVRDPRPFTAENAASYMKNFRVSQTLKQFLGK